MGPLPAGKTVASALLVDYVLTVAVSVSSGTQYAASALPGLRGHETIFAVGLVVLLTLANLRGVKESGTAFAVPVYLFMVSVGLTAVTTGAGKMPAPQPSCSVWCGRPARTSGSAEADALGTRAPRAAAG